jgi:poly-beta-1,6-N-acetyl-D-glucosamine synthase
MEIIFWTLLGFVFYTYLGYPLLLYIWSIFNTKPVAKKDEGPYPHVSVVIAVRNEEKVIEKRIRNILAQDYPKTKLELIVVSDGSLDNTNSIVKRLVGRKTPDRFCDKNDLLRLLCHSPARGKSFSINKGVASANGEVIVFADARQHFSKNTVKHLVNNFRDQKVGCVSGELIFEKTPGSTIQTEIGAYWRFEKWLRKLESKTGSVIGATGAVYAIQKKLFHPIPEETLLDDVLVPIHISRQGFRTIFDGKAVAYDTVSKNFHYEKKKRVRTLAGNWQLLALEPSLLNPFKNPLCLKFLSHKIFRLLVPYCSIILVIAAIYLKNMSSNLFLICFSFFIIIASLPPLFSRSKILYRCTPIFRSLIFYNYCALIAPLKLILNPRKLW